MDFKVKNLSKKEALQKKNFYVNKKSYAFRKKKNYVAKKMYSHWKKIYNSKKKFTWVKLKITRRPRRPKKKYIRFVYYAKKILRWKKINNYRSKNCKLTKTSRLVKKSPRNYTWEHFWRKRKIKKKSRLWHNFSFFLKKQRPANLLKYNIRVKWLYIQKKRVRKYYSRRVPVMEYSVGFLVKAIIWGTMIASYYGIVLQFSISECLLNSLDSISLSIWEGIPESPNLPKLRNLPTSNYKFSKEIEVALKESRNMPRPWLKPK